MLDATGTWPYRAGRFPIDLAGLAGAAKERLPYCKHLYIKHLHPLPDALGVWRVVNVISPS